MSKYLLQMDMKFAKLFIGIRRNKADLRELIAATGLIILFKFEHCIYFSARVTLKFDVWPKKIIVHFFYTTSSLVHHFKSIGESKLDLRSGNAQFGSKSAFFVPCDLEIWRTTLKNNRAPLICSFKNCASFYSHQWIKTEVTARRRLIQVKIGDFLSRVTLKFDGWPCKTIGHLFYTASSFVHHFKAMGVFKLELQSGNSQFGSKSAIFCPVWPWNLTDDLEKQ